MMKLRITTMIYTGGRKEVSGRQINGLSAENNVILMAVGSIQLSPFPSSRSFIPYLYHPKTPDSEHHICLPKHLHTKKFHLKLFIKL